MLALIQTTAESTPLYKTIAGGLLVYIICPLLVIGAVGIVTWAIKVNRRLTTQDQALALIISQVSPPGQPTLRDMVITLNARNPI